MGVRTTARETCPALEVKPPGEVLEFPPLFTLNGSPDWNVKMLLRVQPPTRWLTTPLDDFIKRRPLPNGSSQTVAACNTWVRSKSERPRSSRKLRISVGVREFVVESPPPDEAPTGSTDWLSIDFPKV